MSISYSNRTTTCRGTLPRAGRSQSSRSLDFGGKSSRRWWCRACYYKLADVAGVTSRRQARFTSLESSLGILQFGQTPRTGSFRTVAPYTKTMQGEPEIDLPPTPGIDFTGCRSLLISPPIAYMNRVLRWAPPSSSFCQALEAGAATTAFAGSHRLSTHS